MANEIEKPEECCSICATPRYLPCTGQLTGRRLSVPHAPEFTVLWTAEQLKAERRLRQGVSDRQLLERDEREKRANSARVQKSAKILEGEERARRYWAAYRAWNKANLPDDYRETKEDRRRRSLALSGLPGPTHRAER